ncbi:MAG: 2,3-butanediol dehydrogenase [Candidatus Delongbacteria bacterium]|jgi:(R,R)-butanediol dehydrogenase/meso-butanediol dehydrogenase/diacetyl reductase|nr:2,3-butanediol dehydrogenase [Candidatus Delongbacteria bacterium]
MKAARWFGKEDVKVVQIDESSPKSGEVKIKVEWCGICGTDLHEYEAGPIFIPTEPHPVTGVKAPVTLGHEFSGTIVEIGEGVESWKVGDRVTPDACLVCGTCAYCKKGLYNLCDSLGFNGLASDGGFAKYANVPDYQLYKLEDNMSFQDGALIEPIAVGIHAVKKSRLVMGETAVIIGAGTIGLAALKAAQAAGAGKVFILEISEARKEFARKLGADLVIDPTKEDIVEVIKEHNNGMLADVSIECVGLDITLKQAIITTRKMGRVAIAGIFSKPSSGIDMNDIVIGEKELIGVIGYNYDFQTAINLVSKGIIKASDFITAEIELDDIVEKGFKELIKNKDSHIKILVKP